MNMESTNPRIVDPNDADFRQKFIDLIETGTPIVFVVLGDDADRQQLANLATKRARGHSGQNERIVAWVKDHDLLKDECLKYLKTASETAVKPDKTFDETTYEKVMAFVLSPVWHETKYIFKEGDVVDNFSVVDAYWIASLKEREKVDPPATT